MSSFSDEIYDAQTHAQPTYAVHKQLTDDYDEGMRVYTWTAHAQLPVYSGRDVRYEEIYR